MNKENRQVVLDEYLSTSKKASYIARAIMATLSLFALGHFQPLGALIISFWTFDLLQYTFLGIRANLVLLERMSIKTFNKLGPIGNMFYFGKIALTLFSLWGI